MFCFEVSQEQKKMFGFNGFLQPLYDPFPLLLNRELGKGTFGVVNLAQDSCGKHVSVFLFI